MQVVIIHGTEGAPDGNWFPWLASKVEAAGATAIVPKFPTPEGQSLTNWQEVADTEIRELDGDTVLVGHSLGATFALRLLEQTSTPVAATFLVSGVTGTLGLDSFDRLNASFTEGDFDWAKIRAGSNQFAVYSGDDDPYVPLDMGKHLASAVGSELILVPNGGHINAESGFDKFDRLWNDLEPLI